MFSLGNGYTKMKSWISLEKCMLIKAINCLKYSNFRKSQSSKIFKGKIPKWSKLIW